MEQYDVLIIGGGVVGCAIARELSRYQLKLGVLEKNLDVAYETSGRNTGVCHGGFAYDPGTLNNLRKHGLSCNPRCQFVIRDACFEIEK